MTEFKINAPEIKKDNDIRYFEWLSSVISYACPNSKVLVSANDKGYNVHITPNKTECRQNIIENVLNIHRHFKIPIEYSKSLAISKKISYFVRFEN